MYLCRTDKDEVRDAAKQALLVLGNVSVLHRSDTSFPCFSLFCSLLGGVEQVRRGRWPTDTWKCLRTASLGCLPQEAWPARLSDTAVKLPENIKSSSE